MRFKKGEGGEEREGGLRGGVNPLLSLMKPPQKPFLRF